MKKITILTLLIINYLYASTNYTFLVNEYNKEIELEAKIVTKIAKDTLGDDVKLFIPKISTQEKEIYSAMIKLVNSCKEANFIYEKRVFKQCDDDINKRIFFTNNYKKFISNEKYIGSFFWSKSRPNITFLKKRLQKYRINLAKSYSQFIEDF